MKRNRIARFAKGLNYQYRVTSRLEGNHIRPQCFTYNATQAWRAAEDHARELPGCTTLVEANVNGSWVRVGSAIVNPPKLVSALSAMG